VIPKSQLKYRIEFVASSDYGHRPWYKFESRFVFIDVNTGILQFRAPVIQIQDFIWQVVIKKTGKGNPVGEYVDVYIRGYQEKRHIATATITGHITTCNNVGNSEYVIEVQADKEIKVEHVG